MKKRNVNSRFIVQHNLTYIHSFETPNRVRVPLINDTNDNRAGLRWVILIPTPSHLFISITSLLKKKLRPDR